MSTQDTEYIKTVTDDEGTRVIFDLRPFDVQGVFDGLPLTGEFHIGPDKTLDFKLFGYIKDTHGLPMSFVSRRRRMRRQGNPLEDWIRVVRDPSYAFGSAQAVLRRLGTGLPDALLRLKKAKPALRVPNYKPDPVREADDYKLWRQGVAARGINRNISATFYNSVWRRVLPHLDQDALRLTRAIQAMHPHDTYNFMARSRDFRDLAKVSRAAAIMLEPVQTVFRFQEGEQFREVLNRLVLHWLNEDGYDGAALGPLSPGFLKWVKRAHFTPAFCGTNFRYVLRTAMLNHMKFDPNLVDRLRTGREWYTFHQFMMDNADLGFAFMRDPKRNLRAIADYIRDDATLRWQTRVSRVATEVRDSTQYVRDLGMTREHYKGLAFHRQLEIAKEIHRTMEERRRVARERQTAERAALRARPFPQPLFEKAEGKVYDLVWLGNEQALEEEGKTMHHCVGGYGHSCHRGNSIIYSVRDKNGVSHGTMEVDKNYQVRQLYGLRNRRLDSELDKWVRGELARQIAAAKREGKEVAEVSRQDQQEMEVVFAGEDFLPF